MRHILLILAAASLFVASQIEAKVSRSTAEKLKFVKAFPCPSTGKSTISCKGYIIDHIEAIDCGGPDLASNMQWQSKAESDAKNKWERSDPIHCAHPTKAPKPFIKLM